MNSTSTGVPFYLCLFLCFILNPLIDSTAALTSIDTDREALLAFRSQVSSQFPHVLASWDDQTSSSPCNWTGVSCDDSGNRVVALALSSLGLVGSITPFIGNLSMLQSLQLQNNQLSGTLPDQICSLFQLRVLNVSINRFTGSIPLNITKLAELRVLDLSMNELRGRLPSQLGLLLKLQVLNLGRNLLSGPIPGSISNISSLLELHLSTNYLSGFIPGELGLLRSLKVLDLTINVLTGTVPSSIYNISSLTYLALASNQLWGEIPRNVGETLPNLLVFRFCFNSFTGGIPSSLHNLTNIRIIRMAHNLLQGTIPPGLGNLPFLEMYNIRYNRIVSSGDGLGFVTSLTNSTRLKLLAIDGNLFEGEIPESVGDLSKDLTLLYMGDNRIHGSIPSSIARLHGLTLLNISYSDITGEIPDEIGQLENLQELILAGNKIRGRIPDSFGKLLNLSIADLSRNELVGRIPSSFGNFHSLISLDLSSNRFHGSIPNEILSLPSLSIALNLSHNYLTGELNEDIGLLHNIATIDLSANFLSGNIPSSIRNCKGLVRLYLARNSFSGSIPSNVKELRGLEVLDLSYNNLSGVIPPELLHLQSLQFLDLSFNNLLEDSCSDEAPLNHSHVRFEGNSKLSLSKACKNGGTNHKTLMTVYVSVAALATLTACSYLFIWFYLRKNTAKSTQNLGADEYQLVSFDELRHATENFSSENLLGSGGFGTVYRGKLSDNSVVAIKAFNVKRTGSWDSFMAECKALSKVRHRNIVKLITTCSSLDSKNEEFWALVYEFLPNGSLADWLVANKDGGKRDELTLLHRLNIAIDVASALDYLHHGCDVPVVHCDLKPSNILLDQDMTAKVGDFGLAKLLINPMGDHEAPISSAHFIKGSIGYIPPEYGVGSKPSIAGDTYSFGVMLLQLLTGKSPIDESLMESEESLMGWVGSSYPGEVMKVVDPKVYPYVKPEMEEQCIVKILGVGLWCSASSPERRMPMRDALWNLQTARSDLVASYLRRLKR